MDKLYIVVDSALEPGPKVAQACHALAEYLFLFPEKARTWHESSNTLVILEH